MANYTIQKTGDEIQTAIINALALAKKVTVVTIDSVNYNTLWEVDPDDATSTVYGLAVNPNDGKLYRICYDPASTASNKYSATVYSPSGLSAKMDNGTLVFEQGN